MLRFAVLSLLTSAACFCADPAPVFSFVKKNCVACHNQALANGDVNLATLTTESSFDEARETWERVVAKIKMGEMPPPGFPKPPAADVKNVSSILETEFARQDRSAKPDPGRITARRLNKTEYNNTIRDLLGVDIRPADDFPNDEAAFGFDNIADALSLSPVLLEKYLYAAERAVRTAIFGPEKLKPASVHYSAPVRIPVLPKDLFHYDESGLSLHHAFHVLHRFPVDGEYSFRLVMNGHRPDQTMPVTPAFYIDSKLVQTFEYDGTDLEGQVLEVRAKVTAGEHLLSATYLKNYHGLPPKYNGPEPSTRTNYMKLSGARGQLTEADKELLRKYGTKIKVDRVEVRVDNRYESIDIGGPFTQTEGRSAASQRAIFVCASKTPACAQTIVTTFTRNAFRRPVKPAEVAPFVKLYTLARQHGDSFEEGVATALQGILVSPHFLFRVERDRPAGAKQPFAPVDSHELASRLSYFLWSTMPDAALRTVANNGTLRQPGVLQAQVRRMLRDPKASALVENFTGQWLQFKNVDVLKPDIEKFPDFDDSLRLSMRRETELFLDNLIRQDGSVLDILDAKHTFLNERMARFYGVPGVTGPEFRRVDMSQTNRGGGILAHASVLTISSYSTRTSPVLRGKWILENLLNAPPPPPPPAVPSLEESTAGKNLSLRRQMEEHRRNAACASCHSRMDPLGFGLENFNAVGAWRTKDGDFPIDPSGVLPSGKTFQGPAELKALLNEDRNAFVRGMTEKLLTYGLGRGLERYDKPVVAAISAKLPSSNYRFSALVLEIVNSLPFQMRRATLPANSAAGAKSE